MSSFRHHSGYELTCHLNKNLLPGSSKNQQLQEDMSNPACPVPSAKGAQSREVGAQEAVPDVGNRSINRCK